MKKRRIPPFFDEFEKIREMMEKMMLSMFDEFDEFDKLEEESRKALEKGAKVYGVSISFDQEGKPIIREFGNLKPTIKAIDEGKEDLLGVREPLIEVHKQGDFLKVIAEVPGVSKEDIQLHLIDNKSLEIKVDNPNRKYYKKVALPEEVDENHIKANYNNGILEVELKLVKKPSKIKRIDIE